jgi:hypothetical protein
MWPHAGTSQRVLARGGPDAVTAQSPDQGADAQGSRDAAEPWTPLARVWLLVGIAELHFTLTFTPSPLKLGARPLTGPRTSLFREPSRT